MQVVLPLDLGKRIAPDEAVYDLIELMEGMDYSRVKARMERETRPIDATPEQVAKIIVFGYMNEIDSLRKLEESCRNDIRFMYLLGSKRAPDHSRFGRYIRNILSGGVMEDLFYQIVRRLKERGEIECKNVFADGTKIEAYANRYTFVWRKAVTKYEARLDTKMKHAVGAMIAEHGIMTQGEESAACVLTKLKERVVGQGIEFVHGRGKRKTRLQRDVETLEAMVEKKGVYQQHQRTFKGRNSYSKTDPDATFMRMKEDHMRNGQLKPGYNLQQAVEGEYVVGVTVSSERSDEGTLIELLDHMEKGIGERHENVVTDAGYESEENLLELSRRNQEAYVKPQNYEKSKTRKYRNDPYRRENMPYDKEADTYTCPGGKVLSVVGNTTRKSVTGYVSDITLYSCEACEGCPRKALCTKATGNRVISVSKLFQELRAQSLERITTKMGVILRMNRSIQSEGAFGVLKEDRHFRRFHRRGMEHVFTEALLHAAANNVNKFHKKKLSGDLGCRLHMPKPQVPVKDSA